MDKTIYIETDEEITSVLDRLKKTEEESVILVIPKGATLLQSLINLKLLAKKATEHKKEIALVTQDKIGRNLASVAGLSVYSDLKLKEKIKPQAPLPPQAPQVVVKSYTPSLERAEEPMPAKKVSEEIKEKKAEGPPKRIVPFPKPQLPWVFWLAVVAGFAVILGVIYLIIPKARAELQVKTEPYTQTLEFTVNQKMAAVDFENKVIPGAPKEEGMQETRKWASTGQKNVGTKSNGTVAITNSLKNPDGTGSEITLPAGTEFKDKKTGKSFFSNAAVSVPRLTYDPSNGQPIPGTATVKVTASEAGESYNIGPSQFSIPSIGSSAVSGSSSESMAGGSDKLVKVVSEDDLNKAKEQISKELFEKAKKQLLGKLAKGEKLLQGAVKEEITKSSASKKAGEQVNEFEMTVAVKISTLIVLEKQYKELLGYYLNNSLPKDKRLVPSSSDTTEVFLVSYDSTSLMKVKANLNTKVAPILNQDRLKEEIAYKDIQAAKSYLEGLEEIESVNIQVWSLSKKLPAADRIILKISP